MREQMNSVVDALYVIIGLMNWLVALGGEGASSPHLFSEFNYIKHFRKTSL
jgi:hypothetical protein